MDVENTSEIPQCQRPAKRKHTDVEVSGGEALPQSQRMKGNLGWVCGESGDDGVSRHTHSASGRVMLEVSSLKNKEEKADGDDAQQLSPDRAWTIAPKIADMTWRLTPKIVTASVLGNIAMAKDALASTAPPKEEAPVSPAAVNAVATANMFDGLVSCYVVLLKSSSSFVCVAQAHSNFVVYAGSSCMRFMAASAGSCSSRRS